MTHKETHLPVDRAEFSTETSVTFSSQLSVIYRKTWIFINTAVRTTDYAKRIMLHMDDCTYMVVWSGAVILFLDIMKSLFLPPPPTSMLAINDYICIRYLPVAAFTIWQVGNEWNTSTGWTRRHCTPTNCLCGFVCGCCVPRWVYHCTWLPYTVIDIVATNHIAVSQCVTSHHMYIQIDTVGI